MAGSTVFRLETMKKKALHRILTPRPPYGPSPATVAVRKRQPLLTVVDGQGNLVEGKGAVGGDAQQGEEPPALCPKKVKRMNTTSAC